MGIEIIKSIIIGIVEGITEWLPISSTGHMIIVDEFVQLDVSPEFLELFLVVIQIGAILAVIIMYFDKLNPFSRKKTSVQRRGTWRLWGMVAVGCIPAAIIYVIADDWVTANFYNAVTVAIMLILYGALFIIIERNNRRKQRALETVASFDERERRGDAPKDRRFRPASVGTTVVGKHVRDPETGGLADSVSADAPGQDASGDGIFKISDVDEIDAKTAFKIGLFQMLAIIPGTSRSGATIIGGMLCGVARSAAAEFTFFLAIPVMLGWGLIKSLQFFLDGLVMSATEIVVLIVGIVVAFVTSVLAIRFLMGYIKNNDFAVFGWYRIIVGVVLLVFFGATGSLFVIQ